jgi:hypothetical protein
MSVAGATTVVGDYEPSVQLLSSDSKGKGKGRIPTETTHVDTFRPAFGEVRPYQLVYVPCKVLTTSQPTQDLAAIEQERPFFVTIDPKTGVLGALTKLDQQLRDAGEVSIFSKKQPATWIGHELAPGTLGLINHGGLPKLLTKVRSIRASAPGSLPSSLPAWSLPAISLQVRPFHLTERDTLLTLLLGTGGPGSTAVLVPSQIQSRNTKG